LVCSFFAAFLAIDDVNIVDKRCETAYFSVNDYAQLLNATEKGSYFLSNLLLNEDGYAFKVLVSLLPLICLWVAGCIKLNKLFAWSQPWFWKEEFLGMKSY